MTLRFVNNHGAINLTIRMLLIEDYGYLPPRAVVLTTLNYNLPPKDNGNFTDSFNWREGHTYRIFMIAVHEPRVGPIYGTIGTNDVVTFSTYYYYTA